MVDSCATVNTNAMVYVGLSQTTEYLAGERVAHISTVHRIKMFKGIWIYFFMILKITSVMCHLSGNIGMIVLV